MKAILCKIIPATDTKPTRIKASAEGVPSIIRSKNSLETDTGDRESPFREAARLLCEKYGWPQDLALGILPNGDRVFVFVEQEVVALRDTRAAIYLLLQHFRGPQSIAAQSGLPGSAYIADVFEAEAAKEQSEKVLTKYPKP